MTVPSSRLLCLLVLVVFLLPTVRSFATPATTSSFTSFVANLPLITTDAAAALQQQLATGGNDVISSSSVSILVAVEQQQQYNAYHDGSTSFLMANMIPFVPDFYTICLLALLGLGLWKDFEDKMNTSNETISVNDGDKQVTDQQVVEAEEPAVGTMKKLETVVEPPTKKKQQEVKPANGTLKKKSVGRGVMFGGWMGTSKKQQQPSTAAVKPVVKAKQVQTPKAVKSPPPTTKDEVKPNIKIAVEPANVVKQETKLHADQTSKNATKQQSSFWQGLFNNSNQQQPETPKSETTDTQPQPQQFDCSIPYDAAARLAYKTGGYRGPYETFRQAYEQRAVAQVKAKRRERITQERLEQAAHQTKLAAEELARFRHIQSEISNMDGTLRELL